MASTRCSCIELAGNFLGSVRFVNKRPLLRSSLAPQTESANHNPFRDLNSLHVHTVKTGASRRMSTRVHTRCFKHLLSQMDL